MASANSVREGVRTAKERKKEEATRVAGDSIIMIEKRMWVKENVKFRD